MVEEILQEVRALMKKAVDSLRRDLSAIRTGRASTSMLEHVRVEYYGNVTPLNQVATMGVPEPRLITIRPWEQKMIPVIEKAIRTDKNLGLNPSSDGTLIRVPIPELTEERRREIAKVARQRAEEGRVAVRHGRHEGMELVAAALKDGDVSEDEAHHAQTEIQKLTDEFVAQVDEVARHKEAEIMEV